MRRSSFAPALAGFFGETEQGINLPIAISGFEKVLDAPPVVFTGDAARLLQAAQRFDDAGDLSVLMVQPIFGGHLLLCFPV